MNTKILNIYVDETGDFSFYSTSSILYGVSFVFHDIEDNIQLQVDVLKDRLKRIGYNEMIHTAQLIKKSDKSHNLDIDYRKDIFKSLYEFARRVPVKYKSIFVDKRYTSNESNLKIKLNKEISNLIDNNLKYFSKFDVINIYYDNGQPELTRILKSAFASFEYTIFSNFDKTEEKLFQVADMLTFIDKYYYKHDNKIKNSKSEEYFFSVMNIRKTIKELNNKKLHN